MGAMFENGGWCRGPRRLGEDIRVETLNMGWQRARSGQINVSTQWGIWTWPTREGGILEALSGVAYPGQTCVTQSSEKRRDRVGVQKPTPGCSVLRSKQQQQERQTQDLNNQGTTQHGSEWKASGNIRKVMSHCGNVSGNNQLPPG